MALTAVMCVYLQNGKKTKYVGVFYDTLSTEDPEEAFRAIPNRNGGFNTYMDLASVEEILEQEGKTNLLAVIKSAMDQASFGQNNRHRPAANKLQLLRQLKKTMNVSTPI
jgi:hypothetical protein